MRTLDNKDMAALVEYWRSMVPKRPLSYGQHLKFGREQAYHVRALADRNRPAINLKWLLTQTVIPVHHVPSYVLKENSGLNTKKVEGRLQIFINQNEPYLRRRFSLLHELKHALDFPDHPILYQNLGQGDEEIQRDLIEAIANDFAAHVLMPTELVEHVWFDTRDIAQAADTFRVSPEAMAYRLEKLGLIGEPQGPPDDSDFFRPAGPAIDRLQCLACAG